MKLLIASDIHGAAAWCERLVAAIDAEQPDRVVLLGDLLYHGPRNDVPADYAPKRVIEMLSAIAPQVVAVRGNCEAEVDQMVLPFPCLADYAVILDGNAADGTTGDPASSQPAGRQVRELFCTHGHKFGAGRDNSVDNLPPLAPGTTLVYGHTHIKAYEESTLYPGVWIFNPGSVGIPKDGTHSYGIYQDGRFEHRLLEA
ncbi:MAG: phosphodiesterase [Olegusella sp.]|nr:phosphodiesterase [Olegusella sp.]